MKKNFVIGNIGQSCNGLNGQTIKTRIIIKELIDAYGEKQIGVFDTSVGVKALFKAPFVVFKAITKFDNVIILPAQNAVRVFVPLLVSLNLIFKHARIHYVVIGGWLPTFIKFKYLLTFFLKRIYMIYAETHQMKNILEKMGFNNVTYMPNCKHLNIPIKEELNYAYSEPYKICTFSRVWRLKGIADAVAAVKYINEKYNRTVFCLDIYGQVESGDEEWFEDLKQHFPICINYKGSIAFDKSVDVLKPYFFLLFPTRYVGEGIPGTIIDAYSAGLPVVSSRYPNFAEVIDDGVTGLGYDFGSIESLEKLLDEIVLNPQLILKQKVNCLKKAKMFQPQEVIKILLNNL